MMKTTKKLFLIFLIGLILGLSACVGKTNTPIAPTTTNIPVPSLAKTPLPTDVATSTPAQEARIEENCPAVVSARPADINLTGFAILSKNKGMIIKSVRSLDLQSGQQTEVHLPQDEEIGGFKISPDHKALAFSVNYLHPRLAISNALGKRLPLPPWSFGGFGNLDWVNDQQLSFMAKDNFITVLNPYTNKSQSYTLKDFPKFPPFDKIDPRHISLAFDPTLSRAIYPGDNAQIVLLDFQTKQILAEVPLFIAEAPQFAWSPNGSHAAVVAETRPDKEVDEIFILDRNGQNRQATYLSNYSNGNFYTLSSYLTSSNLAWSPDSRYVAFWQQHGEFDAREMRLLVLDTVTDHVTSYCDWGKTSSNSFDAPIWSPDDKQLLIKKIVVQSQDPNIEDTTQVMVIDIDKNIAFPIAENEAPVGWMLPDK
jgi:dipeptidyl aminopeptidase/acylaminoacyl peptidase